MKKNDARTLSTLHTLYTANGPNSSRQCFQSLLQIVRAVHPVGNPLECSVALINGRTAQTWFERTTTAAQAIADQRARSSALRSARSTHTKAAAIFNPRLLAAYERAGLPLDGAEAFRSASKKYAPAIRSGPALVPSDAIVKKMLAEWRAWLDLPSIPANDFIAVGLMLCAGMRKAEVSQARASWFSERLGVPVISAKNVRVKNQSGTLEIVPIDPFWSTFQDGLKRIHPNGMDLETPLLTGTRTETADNVFRRVGAWLRGLGFETQKTNHALRDLAASYVTMRYGLTVAKSWCRHSSITTTERNYGRFVDPVMTATAGNSLAWIHFAGQK